MTAPTDTAAPAAATPARQTFDLGTLDLASGFTLPDARLAYRTVGTPNAAKDNAVLREQDVAQIDDVYREVLTDA